MVCIDNAHLMDATSWQLLGELTYVQSHVAFFLIVKYDYRDRLLILPEAKAQFDAAWHLMIDEGNLNIRMAELPVLLEKHIEKLIMSVADNYVDSYKLEVDDMTKMVDPEPGKIQYMTPKGAQEWYDRLMNKW